MFNKKKKLKLSIQISDWSLAEKIDMYHNQRLTESIGVIGTGKMGTALIKGLLKEKLVKPEQISAYDILTEIVMEWHSNQDNLASIKLAEKIGFEQQKNIHGFLEIMRD